jgi:flagellar biosynthesis/type III secretory pathway protein FliH
MKNMRDAAERLQSSEIEKTVATERAAITDESLTRTIQRAHERAPNLAPTRCIISTTVGRIDNVPALNSTFRPFLLMSR